MATKRELLAAERKVRKYSNELFSALKKLGKIASEITGEDIRADLCSGEEIEFRMNGATRWRLTP